MSCISSSHVLKVFSKVLNVKIPLILEIYYNKVTDVKLSISLSQSMDFFKLYNDKSYIYPLSFAVSLGRHDIVKLMLRKGRANPNYVVNNSLSLYSDPQEKIVTYVVINRHKMFEEDGWLVTPTTIAFIDGKFQILSLLYSFGGRVKNRYTFSLIRYFLENTTTRNRHVCSLLIKHQEFDLSHGEQIQFQRVIEEVYRRIQGDASQKLEFEECIRLLVKYGYRYEGKNVHIFKSSHRLIKILNLDREYMKHQTPYHGPVTPSTKTTTNEKQHHYHHQYHHKKKKGQNTPPPQIIRGVLRSEERQGAVYGNNTPYVTPDYDPSQSRKKKGSNKPVVHQKKEIWGDNDEGQEEKCDKMKDYRRKRNHQQQQQQQQKKKLYIETSDTEEEEEEDDDDDSDPEEERKIRPLHTVKPLRRKFENKRIKSIIGAHKKMNGRNKKGGPPYSSKRILEVKAKEEDHSNCAYSDDKNDERRESIYMECNHIEGGFQTPMGGEGQYASVFNNNQRQQKEEEENQKNIGSDDNVKKEEEGEKQQQQDDEEDLGGGYGSSSYMNPNFIYLRDMDTPDCQEEEKKESVVVVVEEENKNDDKKVEEEKEEEEVEKRAEKRKDVFSDDDDDDNDSVDQQQQQQIIDEGDMKRRRRKMMEMMLEDDDEESDVSDEKSSDGGGCKEEEHEAENEKEMIHYEVGDDYSVGYNVDDDSLPKNNDEFLPDYSLKLDGDESSSSNEENGKRGKSNKRYLTKKVYKTDYEYMKRKHGKKMKKTRRDLMVSRNNNISNNSRRRRKNGGVGVRSRTPDKRVGKLYRSSNRYYNNNDDESEEEKKNSNNNSSDVDDDELLFGYDSDSQDIKEIIRRKLMEKRNNKNKSQKKRSKRNKYDVMSMIMERKNRKKKHSTKIKNRSSSRKKTRPSSSTSTSTMSTSRMSSKKKKGRNGKLNRYGNY